MSGDIVLSAALRSNLLSLQGTQSNIDKVQNALSTGLKVSSALDNPQNYFAARSLTNRAGDLSKLLDGIGQSISAIKQADTTVTSLTKLYEQADSIVDQAAGVAADAGVAKITGNVNLKGIDDLTTKGFADTNTISVNIEKADGTGYHPTITATVNTGDSIEELLAKINNASTSVVNGKRIVEASLTSEGFLEIKSLEGGKMNISVEGGTDAQDSALANAFGFGGQLAVTNPDGTQATANQLSATIVGGNKLVSGKFYLANGEFADRNTKLSAVMDAASAGAVRFQAHAAAAEDAIDITVNGTTVSIAQQDGVTSVQDIVDGINSNSQLNYLIKADYNDQTGEFSIEKLSSAVKYVEIGTNNGGAGTATQRANFGFGSRDLASTAATNEESEAFIFSDSSGELAQLTKDYNKVLTQIDKMIGDSAYKGSNLLAGEDLVTFFNADRSNSLTTAGQDLTSSGLGISQADFSSATAVASARSEIRNALGSIRSYASSLANDLSMIQGREEFTKATINNLKEGSDKLTVADQNEEGAKLLALQTRQQLGVTALSLAAQAQQSVLRLF